ncbi:hypothetical protein GCM10025868_00920 [Angustibacter aerolatus]|uniref:Uncharacterized protein n=1 Tax=Angustibacter aerolatus TaxID=1162965 RepID=A0ABQ6JD69_9ACTN|nr:hypothetical protein GCM10025868_00920 [Angustibacter aerolatus]
MIIVSLGMALVIGTGGVDLSVGATMAIASAVLAKFVLPAGQGGVGASITVAIAAAVVAGLLVGVLNGTVVAVAQVQPIVATLALLVAGRGIALVITGGALVEPVRAVLPDRPQGRAGGHPVRDARRGAAGAAHEPSWCAAPGSASAPWRSAATAGPACWPGCR